MPYNGTLATDRAKLRNEINTDPRGYGYATDLESGYIGGVTNRLSALRDGSNPPSNPTAAGGAADGKITIRKPTVVRFDILEAIDIRDFQSNPNAVGNITLAASWFESTTQADTVRLANDDGSKTQTRKNLDRLVGNTNLSQDRLDAVSIKNGSRVEELFGFGSVVTSLNVSDALAG